jgi:nucleoside phosphorylase
VLTILDEEFDQAQRIFSATTEIPGTGCFTPDISTLDVVLMQSPERGNPGAQGATGVLVEEFRPEAIFVVGIAGGIAGRESVALGDVIVADYLHYWEFRKLGKGGDLPRYAACDYPSTSLRSRHATPVRVARTWSTKIPSPRPEPGVPKVITKPIVAGEKVLSDPEHDEQRRVVARFGDAIGVDMESYGVGKGIHLARTAVDYNPLFLVIRGVSDLVESAEDKRLGGGLGRFNLSIRVLPGARGDAAALNQEQRDRWRNYAAGAAAAFASEVIERIVATPDLRAHIRP